MSSEQISVLVVDDEEDYRRLIAECVNELGFEAKTAGSGREAIDLGAAIRPDVLISDWMLKGSIHGLHVSEILRIIDPSVRTILITGYASPDLEEEARRARITAFIEKPFDRITLQAAVKKASQKGDPERRIVSFPAIEIDDALTITYANGDARELLGINDGVEGTALPRYLQVTAEIIAQALEQWVSVEPVDSSADGWHMRAKRLGASDRTMLILVEQSDYGYFRKHPHVQNFLGEELPSSQRNHVDGNVLIIDDKPMIRAAVASAFEKLGALSHTAESYDAAIRLFHRDADIGFIVANADLKGDFESFVADVQEARPRAIIVAASSGYRKEDFAKLGINRYLVHPYSIDDLLTLLPGRVGRCVRCDVPLPLLNPVVGGDVKRWKCTNCGYAYRAIFDEDAPQQQRANAVAF